MNKNHSNVFYPLLVAICLASPSETHALPTDIESLIQADKYTEAIVAIDALLKNDPQNSELLDAKKSLLPSSQPAGANPPSPQAIEPPSAPAITQRTVALPPITAKKLELILKDVNAASGDARKAPLLELFNATEPLVRSHPDIPSLWAMRGLASLELSKTDAAKEAGTNLLRLGADKNGDEQTLAVMAMLSRKRWLMNEQQLAQEKANPPVVELPTKGFFSLNELFSGGPYADFKMHNRVSILKKAQVKLNSEGHYSSSADGVPGPGTQKAIFSYQSARGIAATGKLDAATIDQLQLAGTKDADEEKPPVIGKWSDGHLDLVIYEDFTFMASGSAFGKGKWQQKKSQFEFIVHDRRMNNHTSKLLLRLSANGETLYGTEAVSAIASNDGQYYSWEQPRNFFRK